MAKLVITDISADYASAGSINDAFDAIEAAFENTLSRDGTTPNTMSASFDMSSNDINNAKTINADTVNVGGVALVPSSVVSIDTAASVPNVPAGNIAATDVQTALNELDTEKVALAGTETITGDKTLSGATTLSGDITLSGVIQGATPFVLEGATDNSFETTLAVTDPTADNTQTVQDKTGTIILDDDISKIESITATVSASALTVGLNPTYLNFRSATLTDGVPVSRDISSALSLVVPSGATLGTVSTEQSRLILLAIDNAGTVELAIVNLAGGVDLSEEGVVSTTAIDATADSDNVVYSTTARSNVAYRVIGLVDSTQATAGTWATSPTLIQGNGGNALSSMTSIGYGQTWQDVSGSRVLATTYYNTTGKPIEVIVDMAISATGYGVISCDLDGIGAKIMGAAINQSAVTGGGASFIVPHGVSYAVTVIVTAGVGSINTWLELR